MTPQGKHTPGLMAAQDRAILLSVIQGGLWNVVETATGYDAEPADCTYGKKLLATARNGKLYDGSKATGKAVQS